MANSQTRRSGRQPPPVADVRKSPGPSRGGPPAAWQLNHAQREAVAAPSGPLLVLAGAGTGKTRVVTCRIAELIRRRTPPQRILAVTFTNKAAGEMQQRAAALLGRNLREKPEISTFHSLCVRVLRRHIKRLGYPQQFAICDRSDQEAVARTALREMNVPGESLRPGDLVYLVGQWKSRGLTPEGAQSAAATDREALAAAAYRRYQNALRTAGSVDFDDLLLLTQELLTRFDDVRRAEAGRFDHLHIDEYQDTSGSQYEIIKALATHRNLCVVGDDDQSIYGFRGAEVAHILRFQGDWPDAKVVRLEDNYRSRPEILTMANTLIAYNSHRHDKVLRASRAAGERPRIVQYQDETEEAEETVADIRRLLSAGLAPRDVAILVRTNEQPRAFEMELRRTQVPYVLVGGRSFYDRKEVRDVLAYLKVAAQPADEVSLLRIINTPPRGIGQGVVKALTGEATRRGCPLWDVLPDAASIAGIAPAGVEAVGRFRHMMEVFHARAASPPGAPNGTASADDESTSGAVPLGPLVQLATELLRVAHYRAEIERVYKEPRDQEARWQSVEELVSTVGTYEQRGKKKKNSLAGFLEEVALLAREDEADKDESLKRNAVALMTLHSAKGLEFPHVYLVGMEEGLLPHYRAIEEQGSAIDEERRLCYVGVTRAQDRLTLSLALSRMKWGKPRPSAPSRFLYELTGQADHPNAAAVREGKTRAKKTVKSKSKPRKKRRATS